MQIWALFFIINQNIVLVEKTEHDKEINENV